VFSPGFQNQIVIKSALEDKDDYKNDTLHYKNDIQGFWQMIVGGWRNFMSPDYNSLSIEGTGVRDIFVNFKTHAMCHIYRQWNRWEFWPVSNYDRRMATLIMIEEWQRLIKRTAPTVLKDSRWMINNS